jgi:hypothetical protein
VSQAQPGRAGVGEAPARVKQVGRCRGGADQAERVGHG